MAFKGEERVAELAKLPHWRDVLPERDAIRSTFVFSDFKQAISFMVQVSFYADQSDHHPEWSNVYNRVEITLATHTAHGFTEKDVFLANQIENVAKLFQPTRS